MAVSESAVSCPPKFLSGRQCAERYGFSERHWQRLVDSGKAPTGTKFNRLVRWSIDSLRDWERNGCQPVAGGDQ